MADDVGVGVFRWVDEAVVDVFGCGPACYEGDWVVVLEGGGVALVVGSAACEDALDCAVGGGGGDEGEEEGEGEHVCFGGWWVFFWWCLL